MRVCQFRHIRTSLDAFLLSRTAWRESNFAGAEVCKIRFMTSISISSRALLINALRSGRSDPVPSTCLHRALRSLSGACPLMFTIRSKSLSFSSRVPAEGDRPDRHSSRASTFASAQMACHRRRQPRAARRQNIRAILARQRFRHRDCGRCFRYRRNSTCLGLVANARLTFSRKCLCTRASPVNSG